MMNDHIRERIASLEKAGEAVAETLESCRKAALLAQSGMAIGALAFAIGLFGIVQIPVAVMLAAFAAMIGGFVLYGSNRSTRMEAEQKAQALQRERAQWIDKLELFDAGASLH